MQLSFFERIVAGVDRDYQDRVDRFDTNRLKVKIIDGCWHVAALGRHCFFFVEFRPMCCRLSILVGSVSGLTDKKIKTPRLCLSRAHCRSFQTPLKFFQTPRSQCIFNDGRDKLRQTRHGFDKEVLQRETMPLCGPTGMGVYIIRLDSRLRLSPRPTQHKSTRQYDNENLNTPFLNSYSGRYLHRVFSPHKRGH